jgi:hypothetical protein
MKGVSGTPFSLDHYAIRSRCMNLADSASRIPSDVPVLEDGNGGSCALDILTKLNGDYKGSSLLQPAAQ